MNNQLIRILFFVSAIILTGFLCEDALAQWCGVPTEPCDKPQQGRHCGNNENPEDDDPNTKCGPEECGNCTCSPVYASSGSYATSETDISIPTRGFPLSVIRVYNSARAVTGIFGYGWTSNISVRLAYATYQYTLNPPTYYTEAVVQMPDGKTYRFTEDSPGVFTPPAGSHETLTRDGSDFVLQLGLSRNHYRFDGDGYLKSITDEYGNAQVFDRQGGQLTRIHDQRDGVDSGRYLDFYYNTGNGRIDRIVDSAGRQVNYGSSGGYLSVVTNPQGLQTHYDYDYTGRFGVSLLTGVKDHWNRQITTITYFSDKAEDPYSYNRVKSYTDQGETYTYTYDYVEQPECSDLIDNDGDGKADFAYSSNGDPECSSVLDNSELSHIDPPADQTAKADSLNNRWVHTYTQDGLITRRGPPGGSGGAVVSTEYDENGQITSATEEFDGKSIQTCYSYNPNGSTATLTRDCSGSGAIKFEHTYDIEFPEKVTMITPRDAQTNSINLNWQAWQYEYYHQGIPGGPPGSLRTIWRVRDNNQSYLSGSPMPCDVNGCDKLATYTYLDSGQVATVTDAANATTSYIYDSVTGDLRFVTYPKNSDSGNNPTYEYVRDIIGRVSAVVDPLGHVASYHYDNLDRITSVTQPKPSSGSPLNFVTTYQYDDFRPSDGLVYRIQTDPNSIVTEQGYDEYGRLVKSKDGLGKATAFAYSDKLLGSTNPKGLLERITDANGNITSYEYDMLRRLQRTIFPDAQDETYTYWGDGMLKTITDRADRTIGFSHDNLKRLTQKTYPNSTSITYSYVGQKLMTITDTLAGETHGFDYDESYLLESSTQGSRGTLTYLNSASGLVNSMAIVGGPSTGYEYFDDGSIKGIQWGPVPGEFSYQYRLNGQYDALTFPEGQMRSYTYDDQGRLTQVANTHSIAENIGTFGYGYDSPLLGQRTSMTSSLGTTSYSYDTNYQLNQVIYPGGAPFNGENHSWTYDDIGNRLTHTVDSTTANYTYFKNGANPLNGQRLQSDGTSTYSYDANGNMTGNGTHTYTWDIENRLTGISGGGLTVLYTYDYVGRRTSKTVNGATAAYLYDGQNLVQEATGSTITNYVFGPGIDEPLAMSSGTTISYYTTDGLGSINSLRDSIGGAVNTYEYDTWGVLRLSTGSGPNPFGYTSREFGEGGLMFYRARFYSLSTGRFTSEDEIRRPPKNSYMYVRNRPTVFLDPLGLEEFSTLPDKPTNLCCPWKPKDQTDLMEFRLYNVERIRQRSSSNPLGQYPRDPRTGKGLPPYAFTECGVFSDTSYSYPKFYEVSGCVQECVIAHEKIHRDTDCDTGKELKALLFSIECANKYL